jgi:hypothetical protein
MRLVRLPDVMFPDLCTSLTRCVLLLQLTDPITAIVLSVTAVLAFGEVL